MMRKYLIIISALFLAIIIQRCGMPPEPYFEKEMPNIRIGILENQNEVIFTAVKDFEMFSHDGTFLAKGRSGDQCRVTIVQSSPAEIRYQLVARTVFEEREANQILDNIRSKGLQAQIKRRKVRAIRDNRFGSYIEYQICLEPSFSTEANARAYKSHVSDKTYSRIEPYISQLPSGVVRLKNLTSGNTVQSQSYLRVFGDEFSIDVQVGTGYHFENSENRHYTGRLNFVIDRNGRLTLVNELPMENYLTGVVSSEMHPDAPLEAVKAQAVAARGYTLSRLNKQHSIDPFDLCDEVHCQVYGGIARANSKTARAVNETRGKVLLYNDEICETYYLAVCGGHTEHNENVWQGTALEYLRGVFDLPQQNVTVSQDFLYDETNVRRWIEQAPNVFCNLDLIDTPEYMQYAKKYFRWKVQYSQSELAELVRRKTGQNPGEVIDIVPLERGISGRLKKIEIKGTSRSITVEKELEIRRALSENYLYSSCFIVDRIIYDRGIPSTFIIKGAGWGHGVGMCQTGAAVMAMKGSSYKDILKHYYRAAKIVSLY